MPSKVLGKYYFEWYKKYIYQWKDILIQILKMVYLISKKLFYQKL